MPEFPQLKGDLQANKEEKDGAIFYRLVDPSTGREYRLYEIEYLIAIMLDGRTAVETVSARVRDELKFDLSPNDLERFVRELGALGFLLRPESAQPPQQLAEPAAEPGAAPLEMNADDIVSEGDAPADSIDRMAVVDELDRLVRSALLHIKQGMVSQARDYFLAAKKYAPSDEKVGTMLNHFDVVGEDDGPSDIEYLWKQAVVLYPALSQEMGAPGLGSAPIPVEDARGDLSGKSTRRMVMLVVSSLLVCGAGYAAWHLFIKELINPPLAVEVDKVRQQRTYLYYAAEVVELAAKNQWPLGFERKGEVDEINVKADAHVNKGAVLARLKLPADKEKVLAAIRQKRQAADKAYVSNGLELQTIEQQQQGLDKEAEAVKSQLDEMQKQLILKTVTDRATLKKEQAALKKKQAALKRELATLKKRALGPQRLQVKLKKALEQAQAGEEALMQKDPWAYLRAPHDGVLRKIDVQVGDKPDPGVVVMTVVDPSELRLKVRTDDSRLKALAKDAKVQIFYGDTSLAEGRLVQNDDKGVLIDVQESDAQLDRRDRRQLRLVRETLESAFVVAASARVDETSGFVLERDLAVRRKIEWVEVRGKEAIARAGLAAGEVMVVGPRELFDQSDDRVKVRLTTTSAEAAQ